MKPAPLTTPALATPALATPALATPTLAVPALIASLIALSLLAGCGDLPRPFAGRPGAQALRLATPPPARLVIPTPGSALLADPQAVQLAHDIAGALVANEVPAFAERAQPGDWQLRLSATLESGQVQPHYALLDAAGHSRGEIAGDRVPAALWAAGDQATLNEAASAAAPQIVGLLRAVDATLKQSDPNSLYNRPARIFLAGVTGAPGDGDFSLERQIRTKLPDTGDEVVKRKEDADFIVRGVVKLTDLPGHRQQQIEIHWLVADMRGHEAGDVAQGHDIDSGALDHYWGDVASAVAEEAAGGVHEVITNWSGRKHKPGA